MACVLVEEEAVAVMEPEAVFWAFAEKEVNTGKRKWGLSYICECNRSSLE